MSLFHSSLFHLLEKKNQTNLDMNCNVLHLDECGFRAQDVQRKSVRSKRGARPKPLKRSRGGHHYSMLAAISESGLLAVNSRINGYRRDDFEAFLKHVLVSLVFCFMILSIVQS